MVEVICKVHEGVPVKEIARQFGVHYNTIYYRMQIYNDEKRLGRKKHERPCKLPRTERLSIIEHVKANKMATKEEILAELNSNICGNTLTKYCKMEGLMLYYASQKIFLTPEQIEQRLEIALRRSDWSIDRWKKVVFTDESHIDNSATFRRRVWREKGTRDKPENMVKGGNGTCKVNWFGWVSKFGLGDLYFYRTMNSEVYCECISAMIRRLREDFGHDDFLVLHDNARFSTSMYTSLFLSRNNLDKYFIRIPAKSPDMNIIEHLWALAKHKVRLSIFYNGQPKRVGELEELTRVCWNGIESQVCENLYRSLPDRMRAIVEVEGKQTKY